MPSITNPAKPLMILVEHGSYAPKRVALGGEQNYAQKTQLQSMFQGFIQGPSFTRSGVGMPLSITHLGSGSRGNATLLCSEDAKILIDQGFSGRQLEKRMNRIGMSPSELDAIVISHHHGDHGGGAGIASRRWDIPIHCNFTTASHLGLDPTGNVELFESLQRIELGEDMSLLPVPVPHSGAENVAFIASSGGQRAAVITDLGSSTEELANHLRGCTHISIESNYDIKRLWKGPYAESLKQRISANGGHLSNDQTGRLLADVVTEKTKSLVLTHLSQENNLPHLAESTVLYHIEEVFQGDIAISLQDGPEFTHWVGQSQLETGMLV